MYDTKQYMPIITHTYTRSTLACIHITAMYMLHFVPVFLKLLFPIEMIPTDKHSYMYTGIISLYGLLLFLYFLHSLTEMFPTKEYMYSNQDTFYI